MDWQTIDTAPKDGTQILAYDGRDMAVVTWLGPYYEWQLVSAGGHAEDGDFDCVTHGQELPEPPK